MGRRSRLQDVEWRLREARRLKEGAEFNQLDSNWSPDLAGSDDAERLARAERLEEQAREIYNDTLSGDTVVVHKRRR